MKKRFFALLAAVVAMAATPAFAQNNVPPIPGAARAPGLYVQVIDGLIHVANPAGTSNFSSGQFGYAPSFRQPPVMLPVNPGIPFTPPPAFNSSASLGPNSSSAPKSNAVDCEVR